MLDEMFVARKGLVGRSHAPWKFLFVCPHIFLLFAGRGSTLNGKLIHVSQTKELIDALIVTGFPTDRAQKKHRIDTNFPFFEEICERKESSRRNFLF